MLPHSCSSTTVLGHVTWLFDGIQVFMHIPLTLPHPLAPSPRAHPLLYLQLLFDGFQMFMHSIASLALRQHVHAVK